MARKSSSKKPSLKNIKAAADQKRIMADLWAVPAALTWVILPSLFKLKDWAAFGVAFAGTWLTGAIFNKPALTGAAFAIGATHLLYAKGGGAVQDTLGTSLWKFGNETIPMSTTTAGLRGLANYYNQPLQPGSQMMQLPGMQKPVVSRPMSGLHDYTNETLNDVVPFGVENTPPSL